MNLVKNKNLILTLLWFLQTCDLYTCPSFFDKLKYITPYGMGTTISNLANSAKNRLLQIVPAHNPQIDSTKFDVLAIEK